MSQLWDVVGMALTDAVKAERLMADGRARRALRTDPDRMLRVFDLRAQPVAEEAHLRPVRSARTFLQVA